MNLPEALRKQKEGFIQRAPKETVETMQNAVKGLSDSGIENTCLKVGDTAPDFTLEDTKADKVNLYQLLNNGPVILSFFRGDW